MTVKQTESLPRQGFILLIGLTVFWGLNFPAMKFVLGELPPWTFRSVCLALGGVGLLVINRLGGVRIGIPRTDIKPLIITSIFMVTGWHLSSAYGLTLLPAGRAVIIAYTMPLWSAVLGWFILGERVTGRQFLGLGIGLVGLGILIGPDLGAMGQAPLGILFTMIAAWCWGAGTVLVKRGPWTMPISAITAWLFLIGGIPVFIGAWLLESPAPLLEMSGPGVWVLAYIVALPMWFCHWAFYKVVTIFPVSLASIGMLLAPVLGVIVSAMILGEDLGPREYASLFLVVLALAIVMIKPQAADSR